MNKWFKSMVLGGLFFGLFTFLSVAPAKAQAVKVFAGYSGSTVSVQQTVQNPISSNSWLQGLTGDVAFHVDGSLYLAADVTVLNAPSNTQVYLVGPEFDLANTKHTTFAIHGLVGGEKSSTQSFSQASFSAAAGGYFDVKPFSHLGLRLIQADYLYAPIAGTQSKNGLKLASGVVISF